MNRLWRNWSDKSALLTNKKRKGWCTDERLTGSNEGVDGDPVVLVLLVGVGAPQTESGEEGAKEVADQPDDDKGCHQADVAWKLECVDNQSIFSTPEPVKVRIAACLCLFLSFYRFYLLLASKLGNGTLGTRWPILNSEGCCLQACHCFQAGPLFH